MNDRDCLHRFLFDHLDLRGEIVHLDAAWQAVLARRAYPPPVRQVLGEAMAAAGLLAASIKFSGQLTLQIQSQGPLRLLVVQCAAAGTLRGLARWEGEPPAAPLNELCAAGTLAITIDPGAGAEQYQGLVSLTGPTLAAAVEDYFHRSEQLPTRLWLAADQRRAAGLLLQRLPGAAADPDAWSRIQQLGATVTATELLGLDDRDTLGRLFHQETVRLLAGQPLSFRCTCSRQRTAAMLRALGAGEVQQILAERDRVSVQCQFCGMAYDFDAVDAAGLLAAAVAADVSATRH